jgi:predicted nucleic acid-binding protein
MSKQRKTQPKYAEQTLAGKAAKEYWEKLRLELSSGALFIDASAIIDCHDPIYRDKMDDFLGRESANYHYFTSTYIVSETIRRFVNRTSQYTFRGPNGQQYIELALYVLKEWLKKYDVKVICVPKCVYELGLLTFEEFKTIHGWTLTDAITYEIIVRGLQQKRIVSRDRGFRDLGMQIYP